jgi:branched-chain amino acid transport system permease protein
MNSFLQLLVNGLIAGSAYALAAIGYALVYSILKFVNFANGSMAMVGGYLAFALLTQVGLPLPVAVLGSMLGTALLGVVIDKVAYRPLRTAPKIICLITAMACSFILGAVVLLWMGAEWKEFPFPVVQGVQIGPVSITGVQLGMIGATLFFLAALYLMLNQTRVGKQIRAVADNPELASINGINSETTISVVFGVGSALAAVAGILIGVNTLLTPSMGFDITMRGWAACVLGGMGSIEGAIVGGFAMGFAENLGVWYVFGGDARWKLTIAYIMVMVMLVFKPAGLLGRKEDAMVFG